MTNQNKPKSYLFIGIIGALSVFLIIGLIFLSKQGAKIPDDLFAITKSDHVKGNPNAKVKLIEYSDFQCPACANYAPYIKRLQEDFPDNLAIVYRHFPLTSIHELALPAARVSEAAANQDRFWEMHDLLFQNQTAWSNNENPEELFISYAKLLQLDEKKFSADYKNKSNEDKISVDRAISARLNLRGTPTFFLNGTKMENPSSYNDLKKNIEDVINSSI